MAGILIPTGNGTYWISTLRGEVVIDSVALVFLATSFSSISLSSLILSFMGEKTRRSFLSLEVAELCLTSRWMSIS